jgi:hypothetical protein
VYLGSGQRFCDGYFSIEEFSMEVPIENVVTYTATVKNYGPPSFGPFDGVGGEEG